MAHHTLKRGRDAIAVQSACSLSAGARRSLRVEIRLLLLLRVRMHGSSGGRWLLDHGNLLSIRRRGRGRRV